MGISFLLPPIKIVPAFPTKWPVPYRVISTLILYVLANLMTPNFPYHLAASVRHVYSEPVYTYKLSVNLSGLGLWPRWRGVLPWH